MASGIANIPFLALKGAGVTISSGSITVSAGAVVSVSAESGTSDTLDTIVLDSDSVSPAALHYVCVYLIAASGHTITLTDDHAALSPNQMAFGSGANATITDVHGVLLFNIGGQWTDSLGTPQLDGGIIDANTAQTLANKTFTSLTLRGIPSGYTGAEQIFDQAGVTTADATVTTIASIALSTNQSLMIEALVHGKKDDESAGIVAKVIAGAKRAGANISLIGTPSVTVVEDAGTQDVTVDIDTGTQTLRIRVTGIAAEAWTWVVNYSYTIVTTSV